MLQITPDANIEQDIEETSVMSFTVWRAVMR
jgi:hypothetical protein